MTLKSARISSDFELFNEILQEVESNKEEEESFFTVPHSNEDKEDVDDVDVQNELNKKDMYGNLDKSPCENSHKSPYENLENYSNEYPDKSSYENFGKPLYGNPDKFPYENDKKKNSTSTATVENSVGTNDSEAHPHYADSDFESISSNDDSEKESLKSDKSDKSDKSSNKSCISKNKQNIKSDNGEEVNFSQLLNNVNFEDNSKKPNVDEEAVIIIDIPSLENENKSIKSRKGKSSKEKKKKLNEDENADVLGYSEDMYTMYRQTNFRVMEDLWYGSDADQNKRVRSKSAAPSQMKLREHSRDKSYERSRSQSRGQLRPQSVFERKNKKINLKFSNDNISSKIETRVEDSGNPVLLSWLDNKKRIANHQQKIEKEEKKLQRFEDRQKFLQAYQRTMDSSEKVKLWIDNKKKQDKQKRDQRKDLVEKLKVDTVEHQRRLVSPMFIKNRFCEMNPAVIDQLKQKTNKKIVAPLKDSRNKMSYLSYRKNNRETFFKYYLNDPVCPKGYASIRSFTDSVLHEAAKEITRDVKVKEGRLRRPKTALQLHELRRPKTALQLHELNESTDILNRSAKCISAKPPIPPNELKPMKYAKHVTRNKTYDEWMQEKKILKDEKIEEEKKTNMDAKLQLQSSLQENEARLQNKFESKLKRSRSFKCVVRSNHCVA